MTETINRLLKQLVNNFLSIDLSTIRLIVAAVIPIAVLLPQPTWKQCYSYSFSLSYTDPNTEISVVFFFSLH